MRPFIGPAAHHGATPTKDPRVPGITSGGDGAEPGASRTHREIVIGAMVLVVALAVLAAWALFKPAGDDSAARASAAEVGLTVADGMRVETIDGGFRIVRSFDASPTNSAGYYFDIIESPAVSAPAEASTWNPQIAGATAYAVGGPPVRLLIDAGAHSWIATPGTPWIYADDETAQAAWDDLADSLSFESAR